MKISPAKQYAVIAGDVVHSTRMLPPERLRLHKAMNQTHRAFNKAFKKTAPLGIEIFSGDSWQTLLLDPGLSLRATLFYRMHLRAEMQKNKLDSRACIGIGKIDFIPGDNLSEGDGPAFQLAGRGLKEMPRHTRLNIAFENKETKPFLTALLSLFDALIQRCSNRQALAISLALLGKTQEEIAENWKPHPITQQAVSLHLEKSGWNALKLALTSFENNL